MSVDFFIPGQPVGKGRPKVSSRGGKFAQLYTPAPTVAYEGLVAHAAHAAMNGRPPLLGPCSVSIRLQLTVPASWSKRKQGAAMNGHLFPTTKPDLDNCAKALLDGMNGVVWKDDVQAVELLITKRYSDMPGAMVRVAEMSTDKGTP